MATSGMKIDPVINTIFTDMKEKSVYKYAIFRIENKKEIIVDTGAIGGADNAELLGKKRSTQGSKKEDLEAFEEMKTLLTKHEEPRYLLYDFEFPTEKAGGRIVKKLAFIFWCPEGCKIGPKMIYASSKDALKKGFTGVALEIQACDWDELDYYNIIEGKIESQIR